MALIRAAVNTVLFENGIVNELHRLPPRLPFETVVVIMSEEEYAALTTDRDRCREALDILRDLRDYIGYAACHGNKCRLPHCHDCNEDAGEEYDKLDALERRARILLSEK